MMHGMTWGHALLIGLTFLAADIALLGPKWLTTRLIRRRKQAAITAGAASGGRGIRTHEQGHPC
jgi:hypothetical protein